MEKTRRGEMEWVRNNGGRWGLRRKEFLAYGSTKLQ